MSLHDLIFTHFRRKLFALALAILIWLTIHFADKQHRVGAGLTPKPPTNSLNTP